MRKVRPNLCRTADVWKTKMTNLMIATIYYHWWTNKFYCMRVIFKTKQQWTLKCLNKTEVIFLAKFKVTFKKVNMCNALELNAFLCENIKRVFKENSKCQFKRKKKLLENQKRNIIDIFFRKLTFYRIFKIPVCLSLKNLSSN